MLCKIVFSISKPKLEAILKRWLPSLMLKSIPNLLVLAFIKCPKDNPPIILTIISELITGLRVRFGNIIELESNENGIKKYREETKK